MPVPEILIAVETGLSTPKMRVHLQRLKRQNISFNFQRSTSTSFGIIFYDVKSIEELNLICANLGEIMEKPTEVKFLGVSLNLNANMGAKPTHSNRVPAQKRPLKAGSPTLLKKSVYRLNMPPALADLLFNNYLPTIGDVTSKTEKELRKKVHGLGTAKLVRLKIALGEVGLSLALY